MAGDGTTFDIDLSGVKGAANVTAAADGVERLSSSLEAAVASATSAADAVRAGEAAYKAAEASANKAALAVEKIGLAADAQRGKLQKAMDTGDVSGYQRASAKLIELTQRQSEAARKAATTGAAMNAEAVALDKLKGAAAGAAASQANVSKALDAAKTKAAAATKAIQAAGAPIKSNEAAEALGKLGGPLGALGQKAFGAADAFKKMGSSLGGAGPYVAVAVGIVAIVAGLAAVSGAAAVGIGSITLWAVKLADTTGQIPKIQERATKGFNKIFSGLKIGPLLSALGKVADLFEEGSATANAAKVVFESLFQPLVDGITAFVPKFISAFIQFEIWVLKAMIAIKPFGSTILEVGKWIGIVALVVTGVLVVAIGVLIAGVAAMAVGFAAAIAVVAALVAGFVWLGLKSAELGSYIISGVGAGIDWLKGLSLSEIGTALIDGLIAGITAGGAGVIKAITGIAGSAVDAAKGALGIASPSKIFAEIGMHTAAGMEQGVDGGAADVRSSVESMVAPPDAVAVAGAGSAASASSASGAGNTFIVTVQGGGDAQSNVAAFREWLATIATQGGGGAPHAA